jgi:hypothetical protein
MENIKFIKCSQESNNLLIRTLFSTWTCTLDTFNVEHPVQATISTTQSTILRRLAIAHHALIIIINEKHKFDLTRFTKMRLGFAGGGWLKYSCNYKVCETHSNCQQYKYLCFMHFVSKFSQSILQMGI